MRKEEREFEDRVIFYRRNREYNPKIENIVRYQAECSGFAYVLSCVSKESRLLYLRSREVSSEVHRFISFMRLVQASDMLIGRAEFQHRTEDLVLDHFKKRFPQKRVVLVSGAYAFVSDDASKRPASEFLDYLKEAKNEKNELWETFYDTQYIEARRNRRLALRSIPKKLWKSLSIEEANKLDKGIAGKKLTEFI